MERKWERYFISDHQLHKYTKFIPQVTNNFLKNHCKGSMKLKAIPQKCIRLHRSQVEHLWVENGGQTAHCPSVCSEPAWSVPPQGPLSSGIAPNSYLLSALYLSGRLLGMLYVLGPLPLATGAPATHFTKRKQWIQEVNHHLHKWRNRVSGRLLFNVMW